MLLLEELLWWKVGQKPMFVIESIGIKPKLFGDIGYPTWGLGTFTDVGFEIANNQLTGFLVNLFVKGKVAVNVKMFLFLGGLTNDQIFVAVNFRANLMKFLQKVNERDRKSVV